MSFSRCASVPVGLVSKFTPISGLRNSSFICVYKGLYLALYDRKQATQIAQHEFHKKFVMVPFVITSQAAADAVDYFVPSSLADIYNFDKLANEIIRKNADHKFVFCASANPRVQSKVVFLLGCHLIMSYGLGWEDCEAHFADLQDVLDQYAPVYDNHPSLRHCWHAIQCAQRMGWIDFRDLVVDADEDDDISCIHMEEYLHYARSVHFVGNSTPFP